jgi:lipoprotein-releasing system permease protein
MAGARRRLRRRAPALAFVCQPPLTLRHAATSLRAMSKLPFELLLALRYLFPRRLFVLVITLISLLGVILGVGVLIVVISVMSGFDRQLRDRILGFNAHLRVVGDGPILNYRDLMRQVQAHPEVKGVAPYVLGQVLVKTQPAEGNPRVLAPYVRGIDASLESRVSVLPSSIVEGTYDVRGRGLLLGSVLARRLAARVGDVLAVYTPTEFEEWDEGRRKGREEAPLAADYVVKGIFDVGYYEYNDLFVVCSLANAQDMYRLEDAVHGLIVMLHDPERAPAVRLQLLESLGGAAEVTTWLEENSPILEALIVEKHVMFYVVFFIIIVAAFGIMSTLIVFVVQKTREIGLLKAVGATSRQIMWLFLSRSLALGVVGVAGGFGFGLLAVSRRNEFLRFMRGATGFELFPASIYGFSELPALIVPADVAVICGGSLLICLLAGVVPAWIAGRLRPVEALRYE